MNMETIQDLLHCQPFEPFEVRLSNGDIHQVRSPENVAVAKTRIAIAYPEADRIVLCSLMDINGVDAVQAA